MSKNLPPHLATANIPADAFNSFTCTGTFEQIDYSTGDILYKECGSPNFEQIYQYKTYKGIISSGQVVIMTIPVVRCIKCGKVSELTVKQQ